MLRARGIVCACAVVVRQSRPVGRAARWLSCADGVRPRGRDATATTVAGCADILQLPWISNSLGLPRVGFESSSSLGFSDIYLQPVNLGWHTPRADYVGA